MAICVPCYENPVSLERLLNSIFEQDYDNYTLIISDDSKSDDIKNMIAMLKCANIIYSRNSVSLGATKNCNHVMDLARKYFPPPNGYIKLMHHDDFFTYPDSLGKMVTCLEKNSKCMMMFSDTLQVRDADVSKTFLTSKHQKNLRKDISKLYRVNCIGAPSATLFRNVVDFKFFDENLKYLVDIDLYLQILQCSEYVYLPESLISIGESESQLTYSCLSDKRLLHNEYQYVYDKFPLLHNAKNKKFLMKKIYDNKSLLRTVKIELGYLYNLSGDVLQGGDKMSFNWVKFLLKRQRLNLLAAIREKERGKAKAYNTIYKVVKYLEKMANDTDQKRILDYLKNFSYKGAELPIFPHPFTDKYKNYSIDVFYDDIVGLHYVLYMGKRMYMKRGMSENEVRNYVRDLYKEQDKESPHHYDYSVDEIAGKCIADLGAAEGIFSLSVIDEAKKLYLFECEPAWLEALRATFKPYKDKVEIIPKFVDAKSAESTIAIDDYFSDKQLDFVKADIEGFEVPMLEGAKNQLNKMQTLLLCAYHKANAEKDITDILDKYGYNITTTSGYMLFFYDEFLDEPFVRRGVVKGKKMNVKNK